LDDIFYFGGQDEHQQEAIMAHKGNGKGQIDLQVREITFNSEISVALVKHFNIKY